MKDCPSYLVSIPRSVVETLRMKVQPHIQEASKHALAAFDLDERYNTNYTIGTYAYMNMLNRIKDDKSLKNIRMFKYNSNDVRIVCKASGIIFPFRIHRVQQSTRVPRGARALKREMQCVLPIPQVVKQFKVGMNSLFIGYIIDTVIGLSEIFIGCLLPTDKKTKPKCIVLDTLYSVDHIDTSSNLADIQPVMPVADKSKKTGPTRKPTLVRKRRNE